MCTREHFGHQVFFMAHLAGSTSIVQSTSVEALIIKMREYALIRAPRVRTGNEPNMVSLRPRVV